MDITDKGLIFLVCKQLKKIKREKPKQRLMEKKQRERDIKKIIKIREMPIKTALIPFCNYKIGKISKAS